MPITLSKPECPKCRHELTVDRVTYTEYDPYFGASGAEEDALVCDCGYTEPIENDRELIFEN